MAPKCKNLWKKTTARLNEDLITEILLRLPVKSLFRFRCVCKAWFRLIKSPNFIHMHLNLINSKNDRILIHRDPHTMIDSLSIYDYGSLDLISTFYLYSDVEISDPCNGLICILEFKGSKFGLFNPSTEDYLVLPWPFPCPNGWLYEVKHFGFGFVSNANCYKVFARVLFYRNKDQDYGDHGNDYDKIEMYDLSTNSWREIEHDCQYFIDSHFKGTLFNESLHWFGEREDVDIIIAFSMSTEVFRDMEFSSDLIGKFRGLMELGVLNDSLALFDFQPDYPYGEKQFVDVWIMKEYGVTESWTKQVRIRPLSGIKRPLGFGKNKTILLERSEDLQVLSCALDTREIEELGIQGSKWSTKAMVYQESLVSLSGLISKTPMSKSKTTMAEKTPLPPRRMSIENSSNVKVEKSNFKQKKEVKTPSVQPRSRRLSLEPVTNPIIQREVISQNTDAIRKPYGFTGSGVSRLELRSPIPKNRMINVPKTPEPRAPPRTEVSTGSEFHTPGVTASTNGKGSQIRKSLRHIGKLLHGSEKRNQKKVIEPKTPLNGTCSSIHDMKSPIPLSVKPSRRQSLASVQTPDISRRSSLGGSNETRNAKTPPPVCASAKSTSRWM